MSRQATWAWLALAIVVLTSGCGTPSTVQAPAIAAVDTSGPRAVDLLTALPVKGRAPKTGYSRNLFPHWTDPDRNGCDSRVDILRRDSLAWSGSRNGCRIDTVTILDRYSGQQVQGRSNIDIDHVVALSDAWQKGAQQLTAKHREELANWPLNLVATSDRLNRQKGDGDYATWQPPAAAERCDYAARIVGVKAHFGLWVTAAERDALVRTLRTCPGQTVPDGRDAPTLQHGGQQ